MKKNIVDNMPYINYRKEDLILRDELALDRTLLANERTLLAYLRSGISLLIAGVSIIHFSTHRWFSFVGIICLIAGPIIIAIGILRYRKYNENLKHLRKR